MYSETCVKLKNIFIYYSNEYIMKGDDIMALWKDIATCDFGTIFQSVDEENVFYCGRIRLSLASYAEYLDGREPSRESCFLNMRHSYQKKRGSTLRKSLKNNQISSQSLEDRFRKT